jgi:hypothetical protein
MFFVQEKTFEWYYKKKIRHKEIKNIIELGREKYFLDNKIEVTHVLL